MPGTQCSLWLLQAQNYDNIFSISRQNVVCMQNVIKPYPLRYKGNSLMVFFFRNSTPSPFSPQGVYNNQIITGLKEITKRKLVVRLIRVKYNKSPYLTLIDSTCNQLNNHRFSIFAIDWKINISKLNLHIWRNSSLKQQGPFKWKKKLCQMQFFCKRQMSISFLIWTASARAKRGLDKCLLTWGDNYWHLK